MKGKGNDSQYFFTNINQTKITTDFCKRLVSVKSCSEYQIPNIAIDSQLNSGALYFDWTILGPWLVALVVCMLWLMSFWKLSICLKFNQFLSHDSPVFSSIHFPVKSDQFAFSGCRKSYPQRDADIYIYKVSDVSKMMCI